jgi:hypothetical protein
MHNAENRGCRFEFGADRRLGVHLAPHVPAASLIWRSLHGEAADYQGFSGSTGGWQRSGNVSPTAQ